MPSVKPTSKPRGWQRLFGRRLREEDRRCECLDKCVTNLSPREREIVVKLAACRGEGRHCRRELAAKLGVTDDDLMGGMRQLRAKMKHCVRQCLSED